MGLGLTDAVLEGGLAMYLQDVWYVAAWAREVGHALFARTLLDQPIVLYRKADGTPVALEDRCCHRHLPLSMGLLIGDDLRCGYHGLRFNASGECVEIPGQATIPPQARVRAYPVVEKWGWIWIWMGDPQRADPALIPNWWWTDHPQWAFSQPDMIHVKCNYQLISDNVLDVTHLAYVHATSIGNAAIAEFPVQTEREERLVRMTRWILDRPPPPLYQAAGEFTGNVDRWQIVEHVPPCFTVNFAGCAVAGTGAPQGNRSQGIELMALSAPTPETERTTHYFFGFVRGFKLDDREMDRIFAEDFVKVFREDVAVLEAQQRMIDLHPAAPKIDIRVDAAPLAARRMLASMIAAERELTRPAATASG
jgi:phenylpropionate dioxygenase-like ring-hydroxylating dioxygenase large terminal subunit